MKQFEFNSLRFELLDDEIIHIEKATSARFSNKNTFFIAEKEALNRTEFFVQDNGDYFTLFMNEYYLVVFKRDGLNDLKVYDKYGSILYEYKKVLNSGELAAPSETPAIFALFDNPRVTLPEHGYSAKSFDKNEKLVIEKDVDDAYLLLAKGQADKLRELYVKLTGRSELVRFKTLGFWHSRYYKYNEESAKKMILDHESHNIPLDNMVIDTDWRKANDIGIGYDIDTTLFPDMARFFKFAHKEDVEIMFNDHPEPVKDAKNCFDEKEVKFREEKLTYLLSLGLDYWWYDRNWITCLKSIDKNINPETMGQYLFTDITKHYFQKVAKNDFVYKRALVMSNVNDIKNGFYDKIYDSASHRYPYQWTGDIQSSLDSLGREVYNLIKGCENEITYVNSDIGGHVGNPNKEEYIRWMQFATFSPIFRVHATNCVIRYREPWNYDEETLDISRKYLNMRYRLIPALYTKCFDNYQNGEPLFKSLEYNYKDEEVKGNKDSYLFSNAILISPFSLLKSTKIKKSNFVGKIKASYFTNTKFEGKPFAIKEIDKLDFFYKEDEAPVIGMNGINWSATFEFKLKFKEDVILISNSDDGASVYVDAKLIHEDRSSHALSPANLGLIKKGEIHDIKVEYIQYTGGAQLFLSAIKKEEALKKVFLPREKWVDVFTGAKYDGGTFVEKSDENLTEMPLFVREGTILPLVKEKNRALKLDYSKLTLDFYPSFTNEDHQSLYEDDKVTTAYQFGTYRKTYFDTYFDKNQNAIIVHISKAIGEYKDKISKRNIIFKYNLIEGLTGVKEVFVNDQKVDFKLNKADSKLMPFNYGEKSNVFGTLSFKFEEKLDEEYFIRFQF